MIWLYHGLIPKLIFRHATEIELIAKGPVIGDEQITLLLAGAGEVLLGLCVVIFWKAQWPIFISLAGFVMLLAGAIILDPALAVQAFNPITLTLSAIAFCFIQLCEHRRGSNLAK